MKTKKIFVFAVLASILLAPACRREVPSDTGEELTARAEGNFPETRTSYDSDYSIGNFAWESTDQIAVCMSNGQYNVVAIRPDSSDPGLGRFLCSTTSTTTRAYYAVYPASARVAGHYGADYLAVDYPASYDIRGDLTSERAVAPMVANNASTTTELDFYHVGALIRLTLPVVKQNTKTVKVTFDQGVTGTFIVSNPGTDHPTVAPAAASGRNEVSFVVSDAGLAADTQVILNIPVPCGTTGTTYDGLAIDLLDGNNASLGHEEYGDPIVLERHHGEKVVIRDLNVNLTYSYPGDIGNISRTGTAVLHDYTQDETITVNQYESGTLVGPSPWKAYFSATAPTTGQGPSDWSPVPLRDAHGDSWLSLSAYEGDGNANAVRIRVKQTTAATRDLMGDASAMVPALQSGPGVTDLDLSTYDILNKTTGNPCETANSYVIQTYGSYLIPCVYGNAKSGGANNPKSYTAQVTGSAPAILPSFINADGRAIGNPVITKDGNLTKSTNLEAVILWQDVLEGYEILREEDVEYVSTNGTAANCPYIRVDFQKERMMPGNIVIALYDRTNHKILWSWHLWITAETLSQQKVTMILGTTASPVPSHIHLLNVNLGWTPPVSYGTGTSIARNQHVIIVNATDGTVLDTFQVSQAAHTQTGVSCIRYSNTFYQWGRKDAFLPSSGEYSNKAIVYHPDFVALGEGTALNSFTSANTEYTDGILQEMIRSPYRFFVQDAAHKAPFNLWNNNADSGDDSAVEKTVYDPSPRGFCIPRKYAYSGFSSANMNNGPSYSYWVSDHGEFPAGRSFSVNHSNDRNSMTCYVPAEGCRRAATGEPTAINKSGYLLTAGRADSNRNRSQYMYFTESSTISPCSADQITYGFGVRPALIVDPE